MSFSFSNFRSLTYAAPDIQIFNQAKAAGKEVFQIIDRKPTIDADSGGMTFEVIDGNINIRDVHFAYPSRQEKLVLQGFSLSIPAGTVVALVGSSGCGKSTIMSLLMRFYDPVRGWSKIHYLLLIAEFAEASITKESFTCKCLKAS